MSNSTMDIGRDIVEIGALGSGRVYCETGVTPLAPYPSVTTITGTRDDPAKDRALKGWRLKYDGVGGTPYYEHIRDYSQWRGTLLHWVLLNAIDPSLEPTKEEREAISNIEDRQKKYDFINSIAKNHDEYTDENFPSKVTWLNKANDASKDDPITLTDIYADDHAWFMDTAPELIGISEQDVIGTEVRLVNHEYCFGGQFDLLYNDDRTTTLLDIKTSKRVYWSAKRQLEAYARTIETSEAFATETIDELAVLRANPDEQTSEISRLSEWDESRATLWNDFTQLNEKVQPHTAMIDTDEIDLS